MRAVLIVVGDAGEVDQVSIIGDTDKDVALVRRAFREWKRALHSRTEGTPVAAPQGQGSGGAS
jgi:hypothetical protein